MQIIGQPETAELLCMDGSPLSPAFPKELVRAAQWDCWTDEDEEDIRLIDMGESFRLESNLSCLAQPSELRAPETFFTGKFDYRVDLWRVGCIVRTFPFSNVQISTLTVIRFTHYFLLHTHSNIWAKTMFLLPKWLISMKSCHPSGKNSGKHWWRRRTASFQHVSLYYSSLASWQNTYAWFLSNR